jgi:hypothetical protein
MTRNEEGMGSLSANSVLVLTSTSDLDLSGRTELSAAFLVRLGNALQQPFEPPLLWGRFGLCSVFTLWQVEILFTCHRLIISSQ